MQCREIENLVMKYLDGNISELEMEKITRHNKECEKCAMEFELLSDAIYTLEAIPDIEVPESFTAKVMNTIKTQKRYALTPQMIILWIIGMSGLAVFMMNIFSFVVLPAVRNTGLFIRIYNIIIFASTWAVNTVRNGLILISDLFSRTGIFKVIMLRDYITFIAACIIIFISVNLVLKKTSHFQHK